MLPMTVVTQPGASSGTFRARPRRRLSGRSAFSRTMSAGTGMPTMDNQLSLLNPFWLLLIRRAGMSTCVFSNVGVLTDTKQG